MSMFSLWSNGYDPLHHVGEASQHDPRFQLAALAYNLRWSWDQGARAVFDAVAPEEWRRTSNPVAVLDAATRQPGRLAANAAAIAAAHADLQRYLAAPPRRPGVPSVAYCSAEFAIAECLPIYSGGLGVLAGDHLKSASDLGFPLVAIGLLYRYGYFTQTINEAGAQRERYEHLEPTRVPLRPQLDRSGTPLLVGVPFPGRTVWARIWVAQVGRVPLYLLDTEMEQNREDDGWITAHLYGGDQDTRLRQEMVLGIGGARLLRALGEPRPRVVHMNEGHSSFIAMELARERIEDGHARTFDDALLQIAPHLAFTTHTPVAAGHDAFPSDLVEAYFAAYRQLYGIEHEQLMRMGRRDQNAAWERFSMTILALRASAYRNGVSQLHGIVSKEMWGGVGNGLSDVPPADEMDAVTNGIHTATWVGPDMSALFERTLGAAWRERPDDPAAWRAMEDADPGELWSARTAQRARLLDRVHQMSLREGLGGLSPEIQPDRALVLCFARRFATYKRAALLLEHPDRLARLLGGDPERPVALIFSGKAHPRDEPGKAVLQRVVNAARDPRFRGKLVFLENYDVQIARFMVQGADVWLNTPRRPLEASGTSGMKAVLNGAVHVSTLDGWWDEAYEPEIGWALGRGLSDALEPDARDRAEADELIDLLESQVVPAFFRRDDRGIPADWLHRSRASIARLSPRFSTHRMLLEYAERIYEPAGESSGVRVGASATPR